MNSLEETIIEQILKAYREKGLLTEKSLEKLRKSMISGKMNSETWISILENDRPEAKEGQNEN